MILVNSDSIVKVVNHVQGELYPECYINYVEEDTYYVYTKDGDIPVATLNNNEIIRLMFEGRMNRLCSLTYKEEMNIEKV